MSIILTNTNSEITSVIKTHCNKNDDAVVESINSSKELKSISKSDDDTSLDNGWAWVIVFASFIIQFIGDGIAYSFGLFFVEISEEFKSTGKSGVSWIASIMNAVSHGVGPIGSILINKFSCRTVSIVGSILATIGYGTSYFATNVPTLYFTLGVVGGIGFGLMYLPAMVIVPQYFKKYRAFAIGISVSGSGLGTFTFDWVFGFILTNFSWRHSLAIGSSIVFSSMFFALFYFPESNLKSPCKNLNPVMTSEIANISEQNSSKYSSCLKSDSTVRKIIDLSLLKNPVFLIFSLCDMFSSIGLQVPYVYLPEIEKHDYHTENSSLVGIIGVANVISRLIVGYLSDKFGVNRIYISITSLLLAGIGTIVSPHFATIWWLRGYAGLFGTCMGIYISLKSVILVDLIGLSRLTDAFGLMLLIQSIGFIIGPPIVGELYDIYGIYKPGFYFAGSMVLVSGIILLIIPVIKKWQISKLNESTAFEGHYGNPSANIQDTF